MLSNQIILIRGDRIADVGPAVAIPSDARVIDLSSATVMPGMIDGHVHVYPAGRSLPVHANHRRGGQRAGRSRGGVHHRPRHGFARRLRHRRSPRRHQPRRGARAANAGRRAVAQSARRQTVPVVLRALPGSLHREQEPELAVARQGGGARGQAARRRLGEDLHDAGFRRRRVQRVQAGRHAREQSIAHRRRGDGDYRRGPSPWSEGRLSHLRRRRAAQLPESGCRCAESPHRSRCRLVEAARRQEAPLHADRRRPRLARTGGSEEDRRTEQSLEDGRAGVQEGLRGRRAVRVRQRSDVRRDPARQTRPASSPTSSSGAWSAWTR